MRFANGRRKEGRCPTPEAPSPKSKEISAPPLTDIFANPNRADGFDQLCERIGPVHRPVPDGLKQPGDALKCALGFTFMRIKRFHPELFAKIPSQCRSLGEVAREHS